MLRWCHTMRLAALNLLVVRVDAEVSGVRFGPLATYPIGAVADIARRPTGRPIDRSSPGRRYPSGSPARPLPLQPPCVILTFVSHRSTCVPALTRDRSKPCGSRNGRLRRIRKLDQTAGEECEASATDHSRFRHLTWRQPENAPDEFCAGCKKSVDAAAQIGVFAKLKLTKCAPGGKPRRGFSCPRSAAPSSFGCTTRREPDAS
jgi:hypothetical protein